MATTSTAPQQSGLTQHRSTASSIPGFGTRRLNTHAVDLQIAIDEVRDDFLDIRSIWHLGERHDVPRYGLLAEIVKRVPILVYDLPELKRKCDTAFVDGTGRMYLADTFARRALKEHQEGRDSLFFLIRHEADHLRRMHLSRMLDVNPQLANIAQDIRINIDIVKAEAASRYEDETGIIAGKAEILNQAKKYLAEHKDCTIGVGCAMNFEDYQKYDGLSEESIAALLMKDWKDPPAIPDRQISFDHIMQGAAGEVDGIKGIVLSGAAMPPMPQHTSMTPADLSALSQDLRHIGKVKANPKSVSDTDLQSALDRLTAVSEHQGLIEIDLQHQKAAQAAAGTGGAHQSGKTGDAYLDILSPNERVQLAIEVLGSILNPAAKQQGKPGESSGGMSIKDIERALGRDPGDGDAIPNPNVTHSHDHVMDTDELIETLKAAGLNPASMAKLGYDDLKQVQAETAAAKDNVVSAINAATEDMMKVGGRYAGGHIVQHANAQMRDFFKPVISWEMALKQVTEAVGKGQRHAPEEPWMIYHVDAADMGFKHQNDVPYQGGNVPGKHVKPLLFDIIDTSGSVDDSMLKRFVTEALNQARRMSRGNAPDVVISFADTIARGEPVFITEHNHRNFLNRGINYGGRGGTNFQASIENIFELVKPGARTPYTGRQIDAIVYMTDTGDAVPDFARLLRKAQECGLKKLPPILFLAPKSCYNKAFHDGVSKHASMIWFDASAKTHIKIDEVANDSERKNRNLRASA
jgi:hypothetical protein